MNKLAAAKMSHTAHGTMPCSPLESQHHMRHAHSQLSTNLISGCSQQPAEVIGATSCHPSYILQHPTAPYMLQSACMLDQRLESMHPTYTRSHCNPAHQWGGAAILQTVPAYPVALHSLGVCHTLYNSCLGLHPARWSTGVSAHC
jgi:hypothetical protein